MYALATEHETLDRVCEQPWETTTRESNVVEVVEEERDSLSRNSNGYTNMIEPQEDEVPLKGLLKSLVESPPSTPTLSFKDLELLASSLLPTGPRSARSLAFLCISKYSEGVQRSALSVEDQTEYVTSQFQPYIEGVLTPQDLEPDSITPCVYLLTALFSLFPAPAIKILSHAIDTSTDPSTDLLTILLESAELPSPLQPALAELLGQAAGTKSGREIVRSRALEWLKGGVGYDDGGNELSVLCAVALSKLGREESEPVTDGGDGITLDRQAEEAVLCAKMMSALSNLSTSSTSLLSTLEGLSVLSTQAHIKNQLAISSTFLPSLLKFSPIPQPRPSSLPVTPRASMVSLDNEKLFEPVETSLCYGITTILVNLTSRKPPLSAEDQQIAKLRQMAVSGKRNTSTVDVQEDLLESNEVVEARVKRVIKFGGVGALRGLGRAESRLVKEALGKLCLNLLEDKENRLVFIRDGGYKVLSSVIRDLTSVSTPKSSLAAVSTTISDTSAGDLQTALPAIQALAKLVITTPPDLLFPPPSTTTAVNALAPLYLLLLHPSSKLLQVFEALMALTNIASIEPSIASRIVDATIPSPDKDSSWRGSGRDTQQGKVSVMSKVEELLLDDNQLVRRAATELICNLVNSPKGFGYFSGQDLQSTSTGNEPEESSTVPNPKIRSRLNILLVLANVDDLQTRLAAGGALAILTDSNKTCQALLVDDLGDDEESISTTKKRSIWERLLWLFDPEDSSPSADDEERLEVISSSPPNFDLVHRGVIILFNLLQYINSLDGEKRSKGLGDARKAGTEDRLMTFFKSQSVGKEILQPVVECLKIFKKT